MESRSHLSYLVLSFTKQAREEGRKEGRKKATISARRRAKRERIKNLEPTKSETECSSELLGQGSEGDTEPLLLDQQHSMSCEDLDNTTNLFRDKRKRNR
jgi:hypothetical protein